MVGNIINLRIDIYEDDADAERIDQLTLSLMNQLKDLDIESIEQAKKEQTPHGAKGDPVTIGAIVLGIASVTIPALLTLLQKWVGEHRKVIVEAPNGVKAEFISTKRYSEEEIVTLITKLNQIPTSSQ